MIGANILHPIMDSLDSNIIKAFIYLNPQTNQIINYFKAKKINRKYCNQNAKYLQ